MRHFGSVSVRVCQLCVMLAPCCSTVLYRRSRSRIRAVTLLHTQGGDEDQHFFSNSDTSLPSPSPLDPKQSIGVGRMPLFKSFRSKSRKSSFTSVTGGSTAGAGVTETGSLQQQQSPPPAPQQSPPPINNDLTPAPAPAPALRTGTTTSLEKKKSKLFSSHSTSSRRKTSVSQEPPARPSLSTNISTSGQLFNNDSTTTASPPLPASFETGPRPSELFASKASQWSASENTHQKQGSTSSIHHNQENQLSPSSSSVYNQDSAKSDDLQNFLKASVPTYLPI